MININVDKKNSKNDLKIDIYEGFGLDKSLNQLIGS